MALLHHFIVDEISGCPTDQYSLVGDDLLMKNSEESFGKYTEFMGKIGVSVNMSKTLVSRAAPHTIEFARNYIICGHRIEPLPTGAVFAGLDGKLSSEEVTFSFAKCMDYVDIDNLLTYMNIKGTQPLFCVAYYLWKSGVQSFEEVRELLKSRNVNLYLSEEHFQHIQTVTASIPKDGYRRPQLFFTEALLSQCSIRRKEDLDKLGDLTIDFSVLGFAGEEIDEYARAMHDRIVNALPISYDCGLGNPLVSKREKNLVRDLAVTLKARKMHLKPPIDSRSHQ